MAAMTIRLARAEDAGAIGQVAKDAYHVYIERLGRPPAPMIADFEHHIARDWVIIAERNGRLCGYAILIADKERALLDNIAVDPREQGSGVGRSLIERVEQEALALGHLSLELYTNVVMTENVCWYARLGFVETKRAVEQGFYRIYMKKDLVPGM